MNDETEEGGEEGEEEEEPDVAVGGRGGVGFGGTEKELGGVTLVGSVADADDVLFPSPPGFTGAAGGAGNEEGSRVREDLPLFILTALCIMLVNARAAFD